MPVWFVVCVIGPVGSRTTLCDPIWGFARLVLAAVRFSGGGIGSRVYGLEMNDVFSVDRVPSWTCRRQRT